MIYFRLGVSRVIAICLMLPGYKKKNADEMNQIIITKSMFAYPANAVYIIK